jgi:uncharacterized membrane protein
MSYQIQVSRPVSQVIDVTETYQNKVEVTRTSGNTVTVSQAIANSLVVTAGTSSIVSVSDVKALVTAQAPVTASLVTLTAAGPQGPSFAGATFFNNTAIGNLNTGNAGAVLEWDGALFQPTQLLENDLQINGGAF